METATGQTRFSSPSLARLPRPPHALQTRFEQFIAQAFEERVLDFTAPAAHAYAEIMGHRKETGRAMSLPDGQIAGIAHAHGFAVATRNIKDFEGCGIELINPFK
ncbi:MAG: hypothetical protein ROZ09_01370 [Thiobacillus sp.]|uniref:hypothetical protein n=1 Tax=Thiobacillus sp. TaxID=924 RepID=UPI002895D9A1|nr:hypothetical protein [Thiobacillus sp.]MDT3705444.1 hypothetical protein [Thiobacillus sp.]